MKQTTERYRQTGLKWERLAVLVFGLLAVLAVMVGVVVAQREVSCYLEALDRLQDGTPAVSATCGDTR